MRRDEVKAVTKNPTTSGELSKSRLQQTCYRYLGRCRGRQDVQATHLRFLVR